MAWPWIVVRYTQKFWLEFTGQAMPRDRADRLRRDLAGVTRTIKEATTVRPSAT